MKYYDMSKLLKVGKGAKYLICFGERSNGKTYQCLLRGLTHHVKTGKQLAIIRRWKEDFRGKSEQLL